LKRFLGGDLFLLGLLLRPTLNGGLGLLLLLLFGGDRDL
jgi:hypothetical protein